VHIDGGGFHNLVVASGQPPSRPAAVLFLRWKTAQTGRGCKNAALLPACGVLAVKPCQYTPKHKTQYRRLWGRFSLRPSRRALPCPASDRSGSAAYIAPYSARPAPEQGQQKRRGFYPPPIAFDNSRRALYNCVSIASRFLCAAYKSCRFLFNIFSGMTAP